jgi:hypothetical protein
MPIVNKINLQNEGQLNQIIAGLVTDKIYHPNYSDNAEQAEEMAVHLKGNRPTRILETYRPNEPEQIKKYRLEVYEPITKSQGKRIVNVLSKIQQSSNYNIEFPEQKNIAEDESLKAYTTKDFPIFGSVESWGFDVALKQGLIDANAVCIIKPLEIPEDNTTYYKPFPFIYRSDQVLDYGLNYFILLEDEKNVINNTELNIWCIVTDKEILKIKQVDPKNLGRVEIEVLFKYDFKDVPGFFLKGDYREETVPFAYDSFVSGVLPYWNKAIRLDSDLDAQYNQHLFLERVEIEVECDEGCSPKSITEKVRGFTKVENGEEKFVSCSRCNGSGWINGRSPYGVTTVRKDAFEGEKTDFPGVTYIDKPIDIVQLTEDKVAKQISSGFQAINLDIIDKVGANQSGVAKTIDRSELESFLNKISDNLFDNILYNSYKFISIWRYNLVNQDLIPTINKPTKFNTFSEVVMAEEMKFLKEAGVNPNTLVQMELDFIAKKFPNDIEKQKFNSNIIDLDPLSDKSEEEKAEIVLTGGTTRQNYIISTNIRSFILTAIENDPEYLDKARSEKITILKALADELTTQAVTITDNNGDTEEIEQTS